MKKVLGAFSRFMRPKIKLFLAKFRRNLEVSPCDIYKNKFIGHYHDFCVQKRSSLPWSSDGFWKFSPCKLYKKVMRAIMRPKTKLLAVKFRRISDVLRLQGLQKSCGRIFTIYASKNEAVCCEVQTHFGRFRFARFVKKVLGIFSRFVRTKMKLFPAKFRRIMEDFTLRGI